MMFRIVKAIKKITPKIMGALFIASLDTKVLLDTMYEITKKTVSKNENKIKLSRAPETPGTAGLIYPCSFFIAISPFSMC